MIINWTAVGSIATVLMTIVTGIMAWVTYLAVRKSKETLNFYYEQLKYQYAPTFFIENVANQPKLPTLIIRNRGNGAAYDNTILLRLIRENNVYPILIINNKDYWPTQNTAQYDKFDTDCVKINTGLIRSFPIGKQGMLGTEATDFDIEILIFYTDQLHERYKASCPLRIFLNQQTGNYETFYKSGRVFKFSNHNCEDDNSISNYPYVNEE